MLQEIRNCYEHLTETEKRVADAVLASPEETVKMTVKSLAERADTVPSAVVRFCKSVGVKGFAEMKLKLSMDMGGRREETPMLPVSENDSAENVFAKVFASGVRTLNDTLKMMDFLQIEKIVAALQSASRIVFFGVGTSSVIATDAQYRLAQLGLSTAACTDILFMNVTAANMRKGEVAVGISHSGNTKATVDALRRARGAGAETMAISSFARSRLAQEADLKMIAFSDDRNYPVEAVSARIAHMCMIDALMMALAAQDYAALRRHLNERNEVLEQMRYKTK